MPNALSSITDCFSDDVDSWKTYSLMLIYICNPYAPEEAKLIKSGALTMTRTVTNSEYSYNKF